jgi:hypothetical protein
MHLDRRAVRRFAHPCIQILAFSGLEEEDVVAVVEFSELVQLVELRLGVELRLFSAVRPVLCEHRLRRMKHSVTYINE